MLTILLLLVLAVVPLKVQCHTYHMGSDCPTVEPMSDFNMDKVRITLVI